MKDMWNAFSIEFVRAVKRPWFYIALLLGVIILLSERWEDYCDALILGNKVPDTYSFAFMLGVCLSYTVFPFVFVPLCTLNGSLGFCEDTAHGYYLPICSRISKRAYIRGHIVSSAVLGGLTGAGIILVSGAVLRCLYPSHTAAMQSAELGGMPDSVVLLCHGWGYVGKVAAAFFFGGMALALLGLACSAIVANRYVAVLSPLLLFVAVNFIMHLLGMHIALIDLLMAYDSAKIPLVVSILVYSLIGAISGIVFSVHGEKRLAGE